MLRKKTLICNISSRNFLIWFISFMPLLCKNIWFTAIYQMLNIYDFLYQTNSINLYSFQSVSWTRTLFIYIIFLSHLTWPKYNINFWIYFWNRHWIYIYRRICYYGFVTRNILRVCVRFIKRKELWSVLSNNFVWMGFFFFSFAHTLPLCLFDSTFNSKWDVKRVVGAYISNRIDCFFTSF